MYSKAERSNTKKEFWTVFGAYMKPVPNAEGEKINWINYKTGIRHIYFRLDAETKHCSVAIEIKSNLPEERTELYQKFLSLHSIFITHCGSDWEWIETTRDEDGVIIAKIYCEKPGVNVMNRDDWPHIISFFKERMIQLDEFWNFTRVNFE